MKFYLQLQHKLFQRQVKDFGIEPLLGFILIFILFIILSFSIFKKAPILNIFTRFWH